MLSTVCSIARRDTAQRDPNVSARKAHTHREQHSQQSWFDRSAHLLRLRWHRRRPPRWLAAERRQHREVIHLASARLHVSHTPLAAQRQSTHRASKSPVPTAPPQLQSLVSTSRTLGSALSGLPDFCTASVRAGRSERSTPTPTRTRERRGHVPRGRRVPASGALVAEKYRQHILYLSWSLLVSPDF